MQPQHRDNLNGPGRVGVVSARALPGSAFIQQWLDWRGWARTIVAIRATPKQVALGVSLGAFIAFTPFIGLQMLLAALVATLVGASRKAAVLAVWISNPLTMGPIFVVTYQLGVLLCTPESASAGVRGAAAPSAGAEPAMTLGTFMQAGWGVVLPMLLGGAVIGLLAAFLAYGLTHKGVAAYQAVRNGRRNRVAGPGPDNPDA